MAPALCLRAPREGSRGDFGGSQGRRRVVPGPASQICGAREMCGLGFGGVGVRCLSGRSLLCSFGDFPSPGFLFRVAAPGVKVRVGLGSGRGCEGLTWRRATTFLFRARAAEESKRTTLFPARGSGILAFISAERRGRESKTPFLRVYGASCSEICVCSCLTAWIAPFDVHRSFLPLGARG